MEYAITSIHTKSLKQQFQTSVGLAVHWNGSYSLILLGKNWIKKELNKKPASDCVNFLGVSQLSEGTEAAQISAVVRALDESELTDRSHKRDVFWFSSSIAIYTLLKKGMNL
jgi:hypothetical protein